MAGGVAKAAPGEPKKVFGLTEESEGIRLCHFRRGVSSAAPFGQGRFKEGVFRIPGFKFSAWMTVLTTFTYFLCGALEMKLTQDTVGFVEELRSSSPVHARAWLTNYALSYLNYATRIVFKSAKIIPVMAFSVLIVGKKYNWKEWLSAIRRQYRPLHPRRRCLLPGVRADRCYPHRRCFVRRRHLRQL